MGYPLRDFLAHEAGGVLGGQGSQGRDSRWDLRARADGTGIEGVTLDFESMQRAGTMLGSGGMIVFDQTASMPRALAPIANFYAHESCGECTPCREGTGWFAWIIARLLAGEGRPNDLDQLLRICENVEGRISGPGRCSSPARAQHDHQVPAGVRGPSACSVRIVARTGSATATARARHGTGRRAGSSTVGARAGPPAARL